jgi:hypothetical protein
MSEQQPLRWEQMDSISLRCSASLKQRRIFTAVWRKRWRTYLTDRKTGNGGVRHHFVANAQQRADLIRFLNSIDPVRSPEDVIRRADQ